MKPVFRRTLPGSVVRMGLVVIACCLPACRSELQMSPTYLDVQKGRVCIFRMESQPSYDVYTVTYKVDAPLEVAWQATDGITSWLLETMLIDRVVEQNADDSRAQQEYVIFWSNGQRDDATVTRDAARHLIQVSLRASEQRLGSVDACAVKLRAFGDDTVVEAEIRLTNNLANRVLALLLPALGLVENVGKASALSHFWQEMAESHRQACRRPSKKRVALTDRTHVISVGVSSSDASNQWAKLNYAEKDAEAFFHWAEAAHPVPERGLNEPPVLRELLIGEVDPIRIGEQLSMLQDQALPGDTVLFFFAGHIDRAPDLLDREKAQHAYLVTSVTDPQNFRFTAFRTDDVLTFLDRTEASCCLFICDACFSGGARVLSTGALGRIRTRGRVPDRPEFDPRTVGYAEKTGIMAAAQELSLAAESEDLEHGIFTYALLRGLAGEADANHDGFVTVEELWTHVDRVVLLETKGLQTPFAYIPPHIKTTLKWRVVR